MTHHREEVAKKTKTVFFFFSDGDRSSKKLWRLQDDNFKGAAPHCGDVCHVFCLPHVWE